MAVRAGYWAPVRGALGVCLLLAVGCGGGQLGNGTAFDAGDSGTRDGSRADVPNRSPVDARDGSPPDVRDSSRADVPNRSPVDARDGSPPDVRDSSRADVRDGSPAGVPDGSPDAAVVCSDPSHADCTSAPGCETALGTDTDCETCGDPSCALANTLFSCRSANGCTSAICSVGYANCDRGSPDCEAVAATGASCLPTYRGSVGFQTIRYNSAPAAIATDGSFFLGGTFTGTVSFGTPTAPDVRMVDAPGDVYGFITRFTADGGYAWTRTFPGSGGSMIINGLAATADGGVVAVGAYSGTIDLDPGDAAQSHQTMTSQQQEAFVAKLGADGAFVWGGTFASQSFDSSGDAAGVAIDGAGAVYVAAWYAGEVDLNPSAGTAVHTSRVPEGALVAGALVKLTPAGELSWVQSEDTGACVPPPGSITLATDGAIWILGDTAEGGTCPPVGLGASSSGLASVAAYGPDGAPRGTWGFGDPSALIWPSSIAPGQNGSVYVAGGGWGISDFDPGPGVATRLLGAIYSGGFILKLGSDGSYLWAQTIAGGEVHAVAGTPDGGVIALGQIAATGTQSDTFVTKLDSDGTAGWTFSSGELPGTVVSSGTSFVVTGFNSNDGAEYDLDPGPGVDLVGPVTIYLSRFDF